MSWYATDASKPNQEPKKCFLKIKSEYYPDTVPWVSVQSFAPDRETRYGFSLKGLAPTGEQAASAWLAAENFGVALACVEYRCSEIDKETFLVVTILTSECSHAEAVSLEYNPPWSNNGTLFERSFKSTSFYAPVVVSDGKLGLYSGLGKIAEERCMVGAVDVVGEGNRKINSTGYAVLAVDKLECW